MYIAIAYIYGIQITIYMATAHDNHMIEEHTIRKLGNFESVSKKLQSSGDKRATKFLSVKGAPG
jgi:hypothetical protein